MTVPRPIPIWFAALLIGEIVFALLISVLIGLVYLAYLGRPTARDVALMLVIAAMPLLIAIAAAAGARQLWRTSSKGAAVAVAVLPLALVLPLIAMLFGVGF